MQRTWSSGPGGTFGYHFTWQKSEPTDLNRNIKTLAMATDGLDFPASTSFGQSHGQRTFLFWTNGGFNFSMPSLQKLDVGVPGVPLP
jgi:hypothetical protein